MHLETLVAFGKEYLPILVPILISVVSDLVVGLTPFPKADGAAKVVLRVLNLFAVVVHSDSPGTLKAPLVNSPPPGSEPSKVTLAGSGAVTVLMVAFLCLGLSACAGFGTAVEGSVATCSVAQAESQAPGLILNALQALSDPSPTAWQPELAALEEGAGELGVCVVTAAVARLEANASGNSVALATTSPTASLGVAIARGEAYLAAWHLSGGKLQHHRVAQ